MEGKNEELQVFLNETGRKEIRELLKKARDAKIICELHTDAKIEAYDDVQLLSYQAAVVNRMYKRYNNYDFFNFLFFTINLTSFKDVGFLVYIKETLYHCFVVEGFLRVCKFKENQDLLNFSEFLIYS